MRIRTGDVEDQSRLTATTFATGESTDRLDGHDKDQFECAMFQKHSESAFYKWTVRIRVHCLPATMRRPLTLAASDVLDTPLSSSATCVTCHSWTLCVSLRVRRLVRASWLKK